MLVWRFGNPSKKGLGLYEFMRLMSPSTLITDKEL